MDYQTIIRAMSPEVYQSLLRALEVGKWPDGRALTERQKSDCMSAVIAYGEAHLPPDQRVGFIDKGHKAGDTCDTPVPLNWKD